MHILPMRSTSGPARSPLFISVYVFSSQYLPLLEEREMFELVDRVEEALLVEPWEEVEEVEPRRECC
jgi:hypothetical protein